MRSPGLARKFFSRRLVSSCAGGRAAEVGDRVGIRPAHVALDAALGVDQVKLVQVRIGPAERRLNHAVEPVHPDVMRHANQPPHLGLNVEQAESKFESAWTGGRHGERHGVYPGHVERKCRSVGRVARSSTAGHWGRDALVA